MNTPSSKPLQERPESEDKDTQPSKKPRNAERDDNSHTIIDVVNNSPGQATKPPANGPKIDTPNSASKFTVKQSGPKQTNLTCLGFQGPTKTSIKAEAADNKEEQSIKDWKGKLNRSDTP